MSHSSITPHGQFAMHCLPCVNWLKAAPLSVLA